MMYVALTYDHRIVDSREAVTFLKHIKACIEEPAAFSWRFRGRLRLVKERIPVKKELQDGCSGRA